MWNDAKPCCRGRAEGGGGEVKARHAGLLLGICNFREDDFGPPVSDPRAA
jgi:hypothetical protein